MKQIFKIINMLRPYWRFMAQSLFVGILVMGFTIPGPYLTKVLIDDVYPHRDSTLLIGVLILGAGISLALGFTSFTSGYFAQCVGINMGFDFQSRFYQHIQSLDFGFFDNRETGEILSRFRDMRGSISSIIGMINTLIINVLHLLIFPPILFFINWKLALISLTVLPFDTVLVLITRKYMARFSKHIAERSAELSAATYESLLGIRTVQALGMEARFFDKLKGLFFGVADLQTRSSLFSGSAGFLATIFKTAGTLAYSWYGWTQVLNGNLSLGTFMAFSGYIGYLYGPIGNLIGLIQRIEVTLVHTQRFFEVYDLQPAIRNRQDLPSPRIKKGEIAFHDVTFAYDGKRPVLAHIDLRIAAKTTVAIVGRSGSGKSTLAKLIPRFYDPQSGYVAIDGQDIRQVQLYALRQQIGFVMQGSTLFQGSVLDNLTFGRNISLRDVEDAARAAYIHDAIAHLPDGYHTRVGERGAQLSEGQKQRIALARVLLQDVPILILDEPTSSLDLESEHHIQQALQTVRQGRTTLIITHRLHAIQHADDVIAIGEAGVSKIEKSELKAYFGQTGHYDTFGGTDISLVDENCL